MKKFEVLNMTKIDFTKREIRLLSNALDGTNKEYNSIKKKLYKNLKSSHNSDFKASPKPCPACDGTGKIEGNYLDAKCINCGGTGKAS